ncbi:zinc metalloproteinase-disintegrin-like crotastatin [Lineus longissimus]|uniref:zinc metalloproteinase-disintegrin-like crotastatin n=1 Tax=Lineus longissimus TaxID=88925 RepID=UPI002B4D6BD6
MLMSPMSLVSILGLASLVTAKTSTVRESIDQHPDLDFLRDYKVVIPSRMVSGRFIRDLSTKQYTRTLEHHNNPSFSIFYNGRQFTLDLQLHRTLISGDYTEIYTDDDGKDQREQIRPEACHYHGTIRGSPDSAVVMSTCDGLRGYFADGPDLFHIQPHPEPEAVAKTGYPAHVVYKDQDIKRSGPRRCGHNSTIINNPHSIMEDFTDFKIKANRRWKRATGTIPEYNKDKPTKYVELFLVFDYNAWLAFPNRYTIRSRAISMVNTVDSIYKPMNVRVILTGVQIWNTGNPVTVSTAAEPTLDNFCTWRKDNLIGKVPNDIAHLIVGLDFDGQTVGLGNVGTTCKDSACGVNQDAGSTSPAEVGFVLAHEMGHNLGMLHDDGRSCGTCAWGGGCVMSSYQASDPRAWTQCSIDDMNEHPHVCLANYPTTFYADATCGNGYVETGEECDCGSEADCPTVDPCCQTTGCKLKSSSECGSGECCDNCRFKTRGTVCRNAANECDIKDMCTGSSNVCPEDNYRPDGTDCNSNQAYCLTGDCITGDEQCKYWFGPLATDGDPGCYSLVNAFTDAYGHCGEISTGVFKECKPKDYNCGKLQCSHPSPDPVIPIIGTKKTGTAVTFGSLNCKAATAEFGDDVRNAGLVLDGTKCGAGKMCYSAECQTLTSLAFNTTCPSVGGSVCAGNGECGQNGQCVCSGTYDPATNCATRISTPTSGGGGPVTNSPTTSKSGAAGSTFTPTTSGSGGGSSASTTSNSNSGTAAPTPPKENVVDAATAAGGSVAVLVTVGVLAIACHKVN